MYKAFYNLERNPFEITPDPAFLFATTKHNEALASLYYGVRRHKGFVVLTGEVGTGKTLVLRCLLQSLQQSSDVAYAYIFNGLLSPLEFLQYIASDLGIAHASGNKAELLLQIARFLIARGQKKLTTVVVVDEAHLLAPEILEEIRLLTNLETADGKLLQILLVGQPELDDKLDSVHLRQLKQRIALRSHLSPLNAEETLGYIQRRLKFAGSPNPGVLFPPETGAAVYQHSQGLPRLINTICENALIAGYARKLHSISPEIIDDIAKDFRLGVQTPAAKQEKALPELDVQEAARMFLLLSAQLRSGQGRGREEEEQAAVAAGVGERFSGSVKKPS